MKSSMPSPLPDAPFMNWYIRNISFEKMEPRKNIIDVTSQSVAYSSVNFFWRINKSTNIKIKNAANIPINLKIKVMATSLLLWQAN